VRIRSVIQSSSKRSRMCAIRSLFAFLLSLTFFHSPRSASAHEEASILPNARHPFDSVTDLFSINSHLLILTLLIAFVLSPTYEVTKGLMKKVLLIKVSTPIL
jgi:hypothetical protein